MGYAVRAFPNTGAIHKEGLSKGLMSALENPKGKGDARNMHPSGSNSCSFSSSF